MRLWLGFHFMKFWVSGMHPSFPNHFPPLRACCVKNICIIPFFPDAPILLALVEILHITKLHVSRPQCNLVCVIFSHECMHTGMALACGDAAFQCQWVGCLYCEVFIWKVNMLLMSFPQFWRIKSVWVFKKKTSVDHLVNQYFHFLRGAKCIFIGKKYSWFKVINLYLKRVRENLKLLENVFSFIWRDISPNIGIER